MANSLLAYEQLVEEVAAATELSNFPSSNLKDTRLYKRHLTSDISNQSISFSVYRSLFGEQLSSLTVDNSRWIDPHPEDSWVVITTTGGITIREYNRVTGVISSETTASVTSSTTCVGAKFSPDGNYLLLMKESQAVSTPAYEIYNFDSISGEIGSKLSYPTTANTNMSGYSASGGVVIGDIFTWMPNSKGFAIGYNTGSQGLLVHPFDPDTGTIGNKIDVSTGVSIPTQVYGVHFHPSTPALGTTWLGIAGSNGGSSARVQAIKLLLNSSGKPSLALSLDTPNTGGITSGTAYGVRFSNAGNHIAATYDASPYASIWNFSTSTGIGTVLSDPATAPTSVRRRIRWSPSDAFILLNAGADRPNIYSFTGTAWGTPITDFWTEPVSHNGGDFTSEEDRFVCISSGIVQTISFYEDNDDTAKEVNVISLIDVNWTKSAQVRIRSHSKRIIDQLFTTAAQFTNTAYFSASRTHTPSDALATYVNSFGIVTTVSANLPRANHDSRGVLLGLMFEPVRVNFITGSNDPSNAAWTKTGVSVSTSAAILDPENVSGAWFLAEDGFTSVHGISQNATTSESRDITCASFWARAENRNRIEVNLVDSGATGNSIQAIFNIQTGTVISTANNGNGSAATATITQYNNSWFRCTLAGFPNPPSSTSRTQLQIRAQNAVGSTTYAGGSFTAFYIYGIQVEEGSTVTSYIKGNAASGATATRGVETITVGGFPSDTYTGKAFSPSSITVTTVTGSSITLPALASGDFYASTIQVIVSTNTDTGLIDAFLSTITQAIFDDIKNKFGIDWHYFSSTPLNNKFFRVDISDSTNEDSGFVSSYLFAGNGVQPTKNLSFGARFAIDDSSTVTRSDGSIEVIRKRARRRIASIQFQYLAEDETWDEFWRLISGGISDPFLFLEDPTDGKKNLQRGIWGRATKSSEIEETDYAVHTIVIEMAEEI